MQRLTRVLAALLVTVLVAAGCSDDKDSTGPGTTTGTYTLISANGSPIPATVYEEQEGESVIRVDITAGSVTLNANDTYNASLTLRVYVDGALVASETDGGSGVYSRSGNTITFDPGTEDAVTATISGNQLTVVLVDDDPDFNLGTITLVFQR